MMRYRLTAPALRDMEKLVIYLTRKASPDVAAREEEKLFSAFEDLARLEQIGHRRLDVRRTDLLFHVVDPYLVAFRRETDQLVVIIRILHGRRNVGEVLR